MIFLTSGSPVKESIRCCQHSAAKNAANCKITILFQMCFHIKLVHPINNMSDVLLVCVCVCVCVCGLI